MSGSAVSSPAEDPLGSRWAVAAVIVAGLLLQSRSLAVFFHHDDLEILENMTASAEPWRWVLGRHVDHLPIVRSALYLAFLRFFGPTATPWHILLLLLHAGSAALLAALLRRLGCSPVAQLFAVGTFAASTVFHECVYWVAASTFSLALFFCLAALLCLVRADEGRGWAWIPAAGAFSLLALLSASIAAVLPFLGFVLAWALPGGRRVRRWATFVAVPAVAFGLLALVLVLSSSDAAARLGGSARDRFDAWGGAILAGRGFVERLAGRYFTGGTLPWPVALLLVLALLAAASGRRRPDRSAAASALAPVLWILASSFAALAFRTWLGDVVFVSRYQLFPAVGFAWLVALAVDGVLDRAADVGPPWPKRMAWVVLGVALPAVLAVDAYAHKVCQQRWLARTEPLRRAHEAIAAGLRDLAAQVVGGSPVVVRDHLVGGGTGYRPGLRGMSRYLLRKDELSLLSFTDDRRAPLHPSLLPLLAALREGRGSWLEWLDDLAVSDAADDGSLGTPVGLLTLFPKADKVQIAPMPDHWTSLEPLGQGQLPVLQSGPRDDLPRWEALSFRVRSEGEGELLVAFSGPELPDLGRGARIRLRPGEERHVIVDVPLATRGRRASAREAEIRLVNELTRYALGDVALRTAQ